MKPTIASLFKASALINSAKPLFTQSEKSMIGEVIIDAAQVEVIEYAAKVTDHPIESKEAISDHIFNEPLRIRVQGSVTDSSIKFMGIFEMPLQNNSLEKIGDNLKSFLPFNQKDKPSLKAYEALKQAYNNKQLVSVVCKLDAFNDMAIEKLEFTNDENTGEQLQFTAEMKKVKIASVRTQRSTRAADKKVQALTAEKVDRGAVELKEEKPELTSKFHLLLEEAANLAEKGQKALKGTWN